MCWVGDSSEHLQHVRVERMETYACLSGHKTPKRQGIDSIFMGRPAAACSHVHRPDNWAPGAGGGGAPRIQSWFVGDAQGEM